MRKILFISSLIFSMIFLTGNSFAQETEKELYNFGGHAFVEGLPLTYCRAQLFSAEDPFTVIDEVSFDTLGYYYFYRKPAGNYFVKVGPGDDDPYFNKYTFTYYPTGYYWEEAEIIDLKETNWEYDIELLELESNSEIGSGKLAGTIYFDEDKGYAEGVNVLLFDENMTPLSHLMTNENGQFDFSELPVGHYMLFPRITGFLSELIHISITDHSLEHNDIQITIKNGMISSYVNEDLIAENSFLCFPNPSSTFVNIQFETKGYQEIQTRVLDLSGRLVFESTSERTSFYSNRIETADWQNGYYFIEVIVNGQKAITQKMAVLH